MLIVAVVLGLAVPGTVGAGEPVRVTPEKKSGRQRRAERRADQDASEGGTRRGIIEFSLGSVAAAVSLGLVGRGAWELVKGQQLLDDCASGVSSDSLCAESDPALGHEIAAGLSFGFAVPLAVASGFLYARGARVLADYRRFHAQKKVSARLLPSVGPRGGSLSLQLRF